MEDAQCCKSIVRRTITQNDFCLNNFFFDHQYKDINFWLDSSDSSEDKCMDICHHCPGIIHLLMKMKCTGLHHQGAVIIHLLIIGVNLLWLSIQIRNKICQYFLNSPNKGKRAILNTFLSWISPVYHWRKNTLKLLKLQSNTIFWFR